MKRRDHWWKPLGFALLTVYWFNPLIWLAYVLLCRDIELACDERVVREMDLSDKKAYSEALLSCSVPRRMVSACPLAFGELGVRARIKSVLNYKKPAFWGIVAAVIVCAAVAVCFLTNPRDRVTSAFEPFGKTWHVDDIVYSAAPFSFSYTPQTAPLYTLTADYQLMILEDRKSENWLNAGGFTELALTQENFDCCFRYQEVWRDGFSAEALRRENEKAWRVAVSPELPESVFYCLLQQKNGDVYLSCGYDTTAEEQNELPLIRWVFRLAEGTQRPEVSPQTAADAAALVPLKELPSDYGLEDAKRDGCVTMEGGDMTSGGEIWQRFAAAAERQEAASVRLARYYTLDETRCSAEYYAAHKEEYPALYLFDLAYDGETFTVTGLENGEQYQRSYRYLMRYEGVPSNRSAVYSRYVRYVLVNDNTVSWEDIERGWASSVYGDYIDHFVACTVLTGKNGEAAAPEEQVYTTQDAAAIFSADPESAGCTVTGCAAVPDRAYGLVGIVQFTDKTGNACNLAFVHEDYFHPVGLAADGSCEIAPDSELVYLGGGAVSLSLRRYDGTLLAYTMEYSRTEDGVNFTASTQERDLLEEAVHAAIIEQERDEMTTDVARTESHITLKTTRTDKSAVAYVVFNYREFILYGGLLSGASGISGAARLTFTLGPDGAYMLSDYWRPEWKSQAQFYEEIRDTVPEEAWRQALQTGAPVEEQYRQAVIALGVDTDAAADTLLNLICASPAASSNPADYVQAHAYEYRDLLKYGDYALRFIYSEFLLGGKTDLRGQIMRMAMEELLGGEAIKLQAENGQAYFDALLENARALCAEKGGEFMRENMPRTWLLLKMAGT